MTSGSQAEEEKPKLPMVIEVEVQGQAQKDSDVTMLYTALKSHPLMKKVDLQYTREEGADSRSIPKFPQCSNGLRDKRLSLYANLRSTWSCIAKLT